MFTKLTGKIKYALHGVKLNAQNFYVHIDDNLLKIMPDINQTLLQFIDVMNLVDLHAAAFLPICVINDAGDKWRKPLCYDMHFGPNFMENTTVKY